MTMAYQVKPDALERMRGVVIWTARAGLESSHRMTRRLSAPFSSAMKRETGLGVLLNTSFNIHGEATRSSAPLTRPWTSCFVVAPTCS